MMMSVSCLCVYIYKRKNKKSRKYNHEEIMLLEHRVSEYFLGKICGFLEEKLRRRKVDDNEERDADFS